MINKLWDVLVEAQTKEPEFFKTLDIKREDHAIVVEGIASKLKGILCYLFTQEGLPVHDNFLLDPFEIAIDFEQGYISFFLKPENHA